MSPAASVRNWIWILFLGGLVFVVYSPSLLNEFVWDDHFLIEENAVVQGKVSSAQAWTRPLKAEGRALPMWRPLPTALFAGLRAAFGNSPYAFHFAGIAVHAVVIVLFFLWLRRLGSAGPVAFMAAALFGVHPFLTSAVGYISGIADPLAAALSLGALLAWKSSLDSFLTSGPSSLCWQRRMAAACLLWLAALCCKEWALFVPAVAAVSLAPGGGPRLRLSFMLSVLLIAGVYACFRSEVFAGARLLPGLVMSWPERLTAAVASLGFYHLAGLFPFTLRMDRYYALTEPEFWRWYAAGAAVIAFWIVAWRKWGVLLRQSGAWRGLLWFLAFWLIHSNLPATLNAHIAEHWMYFAYLGLAWAGADLWTAAAGRLPVPVRQALLVFLLCLGFFWAGRSFIRQSEWRDDITLFGSNLRAGADSSRSHKSLGLAYAREQRFAEAIPHLARAVEKDPRDFRIRWALARCFYFAGDFAQASRLAAELRAEHPHDLILEGFEAECLKQLQAKKSRSPVIRSR